MKALPQKPTRDPFDSLSRINSENASSIAAYQMGMIESRNSALDLQTRIIVGLIVLFFCMGFGMVYQESQHQQTIAALKVKEARIQELEKENQSLKELAAPMLDKIRKGTAYIERQQKDPDVAVKLATLAWKAAYKADFEYSLILAMMEKESSFSPTAVNPISKASGAMQVICSWHCATYGIKREDLLNPEVGVAVGVDILRNYRTRWGSRDRAVMQYYGDPDVEKNMGYLRDVLAFKKNVDHYFKHHQEPV